MTGGSKAGRSCATPSFSALRTIGVSRRARFARIARRPRVRSSPDRYSRGNFVYGRTFLHDADLDHQRQLWLERVANMRLHGTTRERPRVRFDREERFLLQPLAARRYTSLILDRPAASTPTRPPRPLVTVEKRSLAAYARLAGGAA